jgi:hypothetical protein
VARILRLDKPEEAVEVESQGSDSDDVKKSDGSDEGSDADLGSDDDLGSDEEIAYNSPMKDGTSSGRKKGESSSSRKEGESGLVRPRWKNHSLDMSTLL